MKLLEGVFASAMLLGAVASDAAGPVDWPQFRGAHGAGVADASRLPVKWSTTENVAWVAEVPGRGWSSPIVAGGPGLRHVGRELRSVQGRLHRHLRQRLCCRAREAGALGRRDPEAGGRTRHRAHRRSRRGELPGVRPRRADREGRLAARGPSRQALRGTASQEHLRIRDPGHGRRAALRVVRRQRGPVLLLARRDPALEAHLDAAADLPRLRDRLFARGARGPGLPDARHRGRVFPDRLGRCYREGCLDDEPSRARGASEIELGHALRLGERGAHRDRHGGQGARDQLRHRWP